MWRIELRQFTLNAHLGRVNVRAYNVFVCGPKFTIIFRPAWEGLLFINFFSQFSICRSVPEIFAIKVESCQKSRRMLDVFPLPNLGACLLKIVPTLSPLSRGQNFLKIFPLARSPEVIGAHTLNFKRNYIFSGLFFFAGGPRPRWGVR